jgi:AraC-like DNA-binding protein
MAHDVWNTKELGNMSHHEKLSLFIISSYTNYPIPPSLDEKLSKPHRLTFYFFVYRIEGSSKHSVDFTDITVNPGQLLFLLPHQIHIFPPKDFSGIWFKMAINDQSLAQLPVSFPFLLNPLSNQVIDISIENENRVKGCFSALEELLHKTSDKNPALINSYLTSLLTELDLLYFKKSGNENPNNINLSLFAKFNILINEKFKTQPSIFTIASELNISETKLYSVVKTSAGISPKEYLLNRIILEAKRCLFYNELTPKELSYHLGFEDPNYFFRIFKKYNGKSITRFLEELKEISFKIQE